MNTGIFGEGFPYSNFHELNMDWIIKIAKDFLDQYTNIQNLISEGETSLTNITSTGLEQLENKANNLESLLQAWYNTHSSDIAQQLATALTDIQSALTTALADIQSALTTAVTTFNGSAEQKARETIATIPDDYTTLANEVYAVYHGLNYDLNNLNVNARLVADTYIKSEDGTEISYNGWSATDFIPIQPGQRMWCYTSQGTGYCALYDANKDYVARVSFDTGISDWVMYSDGVYANVRYIRISNHTPVMQNTKIIMFPISDKELSTYGHYADARVTGQRITSLGSRLTNAFPGIKLSSIFKNSIIYETEEASITIPANDNYEEHKLTEVTLQQNTDYYIYCGKINSSAASSQVRLYVKYTNDSTWYSANATIGNSGFGHIKTKNQEIEEADVYLIGITGETLLTEGVAVFSDIAVFSGINLELRDPFTDYNNLIPDYYKSQLNSKKYNIIAASANCSSNGDSFIFITDTHYTQNSIMNDDYHDKTYNTNHALPLIEYIIENTGIRDIVFGGDLMNTTDNVGLMLLSMNRWQARLKQYRTRLRYVVGNHEFYTDIGAVTPSRPSTNALYGSSIKYNENDILAKQNNDTYYYDNEVQKIRYFVISCGRDTELTKEQVKWVMSQFQNVPNGYTIVCLGHAFILDDISGFRGYHGNIMEALDAIKTHSTYTFDGTTYNYTGLNVTVGFVMTGHTHMDAILYSTQNVPCISTACDSWYLNYELDNGEPVRTPRTINATSEQCFDVVQFDTYSKVVYLTRIGYGSDRSVNY